MNRALYVGGFVNGRSLAEGVGYALERTYDEVDVFTFAEGISYPDVIKSAAKGVDVYTHSAGMLAIIGTQPEAIHAFNAPIPSGRLRLLGKTLTKTAHMHLPGRSIHETADIKRVATFNASVAGEVLTHPVANLRPFLNSTISKFNAVKIAQYAQWAGIETNLAITMHDDYFSSYDYKAEADLLSAGTENILLLPGEHDELPLRPEALLDQYEHTRQMLGRTP